jgi:hypothetical protein
MARSWVLIKLPGDRPVPRTFIIRWPLASHDAPPSNRISPPSFPATSASIRTRIKQSIYPFKNSSPQCFLVMGHHKASLSCPACLSLRHSSQPILGESQIPLRCAQHSQAQPRCRDQVSRCCFQGRPIFLTPLDAHLTPSLFLNWELTLAVLTKIKHCRV